ncbi:MAG: SCO family protein [Nitrososphaerota archaeon]
MRIRGIVLAAAVVAVVIMGVVIYQILAVPRYRPSIELQPQPMPDFQLIDKNGNLFRLSDVGGKPVFLFFGYSNCPDICPLILYKYAYALRNLGSDADRIAFIFISQDPWRDTPEALKKWIERFDDRIIALTGSPSELEAVWRLYNVAPYFTDEKGNRIDNPEEYAKRGQPYFVTHVGFVFVADREHVMRFVLSAEMPQEEYLQAARYILSR